MEEQLRDWYLYAEKPTGEWFVVEGPTTEELAKKKASELNTREAYDEDGEPAEPYYFWAAQRQADDPPAGEVR